MPSGAFIATLQTAWPELQSIVFLTHGLVVSVQSDPLAQVPHVPARQTDVPPDPQGVPSARLAVFVHWPPSPPHVNTPVWHSAGEHLAPDTHAGPLLSAPILTSSAVASPCVVAAGAHASPTSTVDPSAASDIDASVVPGGLRSLIPRHPAAGAATHSTARAA